MIVFLFFVSVFSFLKGGGTTVSPVMPRLWGNQAGGKTAPMTAHYQVCRHIQKNVMIGFHQ